MNQNLQFGIFDWIEASRRPPAEVYEHKLELAAAADEAGFHGMFLAEHQGTPLSIDGSPSVMFTARHGYNTAFLGKRDDCRRLFQQYREVWAEHRSDPDRHNAHVAAPFLARTQHMVIADTEAQAERLGLEAYQTWAGHIHYLTRKLGRPDVHKTEPFAADSAQPLVTGTPRGALEKIQEMLHFTGANYLLCIFFFGDLAPVHAMRSLELFSAEVMPKLTA